MHSSDRLFHNRRRLLKATGAAAAAPFATFPGLSWGQGKQDLLRAGITGFNVINTLDPAKASLLPEFYVIWACFNGLLKFDEKMQVTADLAESFSPVDGGFEFVLRKGVKFHDGSELTADDVKFTFERLADPATASSNRGRFAHVREIRILDTHRVQILADKSLATLLSSLTNTRTGSQIVSRSAFKARGAAQFERQPIGTGAYAVKEWKANSMVELEAHKAYFQSGKPTIARVQMPLIPEESSGMRAVLGGQLDITSTAPFSDIKSLEGRKDVRVYRASGLNNRYITLNVRRAPFDDVHFRRAVSLAINRDVLVNAVLFGEGAAAGSLLPPSLSDPRELPELAIFNAERAKAELAKSKYKEGTQAVLLGWGSSWWKRFAEIVVAQVNQVLGTKIRVEVYDSNTVYSRLKAGDFDAAVWGWLGLTDPDEYLGEILGTGQWRNFQGYSNPGLDALLEKGRNTLDLAARREVYAQVESIAIDDMPAIPCFYSNIHNLSSQRLQGFTQLPFGNFGDQFQDLRFV
ncbi:ABC transporter substrate-binding protein [Pollutimonas bauzanensis]|uniref:Peptide/nickel transport system substrate-binding protein n=1 Tax=Pollutimonas bauzanensis TaxID=658167 RepID=A0A1M5XVR0_9BURK|nr:ABC transporter substrate-binding protein [Pollutimonas bauzanensis]SHI03917.1 peptide/nickel transport system substrate-binding protein [Pollutimonas bauzanensis]